jgi:hypothetical protein
MLYAPVVHYPASQAWLAQNYERALDRYDLVCVLADPDMEENNRHSRWFRDLAASVAERANGMRRTVFMVNAYSERREKWLSRFSLGRRFKILAEGGGMHLVCLPDDAVVDRPALKTLKKIFRKAADLTGRPGPELVGN